MAERKFRSIHKMRIGLVAATTLFACVAHEAMATLWGRGILLIAMAGVISLLGKRLLHPRQFWAAIVFTAIWASLCFLPGSWRTPPAWLATIIPNLPHPESLTQWITPQAWISLQAFLILAAMLAWSAGITGVHWHTAERKLGLGMLTGGITIIGGAFLFLKFSGIPWPGAAHDGQFGPFANRNQTAAMFAIGAVCATGLLLANGRRHWPQAALWCCCLGLLAIAVTQAGSRAGVLALATGITLISGWWSLRCRQWIPVAMGTSTLLLASSFLILQEGGLRERLRSSFNGHTSEGRIAIWKDAVDLIAEAPVLGTGIGNFEPAFAQVRDASISEYHVRHPESDWLWITAEVGIPGAIAIAILLLLLLARIPWKQPAQVRAHHHLLHITAAVAVLLFLALGCIDVPAHRIGSVFPAVFLLAMAIAPRRQAPRSSAPASPHAHVWVALAAMPAVAAICWITLPSSHRANTLLDTASEWTPALSPTGNVMGSKATIDAASSIAPLDWRGYFLGATHALTAGPYPREAQRDFQRARVLAPHAPSLPQQEARAWIACGLSDHAIPAWREQLHRDPTRVVEKFGSMLEATRHDAALARQVILLAGQRPELQLAALRFTNKSTAFDQLLADTIINGSDLIRWSPDQLAELFTIWYKQGDQEKLLTALTESPRWAVVGWKTLFQLRVDRADYKQAAELAAAHLSDSIKGARTLIDDSSTSTLIALRQSFAHARGDLATGLRLARIEAHTEHFQEAVEVLDHLIRTRTVGDALPPVYLLKAWCHQQLNQHEKACTTYSALLNATNRPNQPVDWIATIPITTP